MNKCAIQKIIFNCILCVNGTDVKKRFMLYYYEMMIQHKIIKIINSIRDLKNILISDKTYMNHVHKIIHKLRDNLKVNDLELFEIMHYKNIKIIKDTIADLFSNISNNKNMNVTYGIGDLMVKIKTIFDKDRKTVNYEKILSKDSGRDIEIKMNIRHDNMFDVKENNKEKQYLIGYKIVQDEKYIVQLLIHKNTKVAHSYSEKDGKMRSERAYCAKFYQIILDNHNHEIKLNTTDKIELQSIHDDNFKYILGKEVFVPDFNTDLSQVCVPGIHFFLTIQEALLYANIQGKISLSMVKDVVDVNGKEEIRGIKEAKIDLSELKNKDKNNNNNNKNDDGYVFYDDPDIMNIGLRKRNAKTE
jgi:hypothetical protein